jgi:hypothetical protein
MRISDEDGTDLSGVFSRGLRLQLCLIKTTPTGDLLDCDDRLK